MSIKTIKVTVAQCEFCTNELIYVENEMSLNDWLFLNGWNIVYYEDNKEEEHYCSFCKEQIITTGKLWTPS
jgi:hypothetical protein